jgi:hypothetical protein
MIAAYPGRLAARVLRPVHAVVLTGGLALAFAPAAQASPRAAAGAPSAAGAAAEPEGEDEKTVRRVGQVGDHDLFNRYTLAGGLWITGLTTYALASAAGTPAGRAAASAGAPGSSDAGTAAPPAGGAAAGTSSSPPAAGPAGGADGAAGGAAGAASEGPVPVLVNPEPATMALLAGGLGVLGAVAARRRRASER